MLSSAYMNSGLAIALLAFSTAGIAAPQASTVKTPLTPAAHIQKLTAELDYDTQQLKFNESMLATYSFADRADLFCRNAADAALMNQSPGFSTGSYDLTPPVDIGAELQRQMIEGQQSKNRRDLLNSLPHESYGLTLNDLKAANTQLTHERPSTREAEVLRQQKLAAINQALVDYIKEASACHTAVLYGNRNAFGVTVIPPFPLPTDDALRKDAKQERDRIAQIDQELSKLQRK